MPVKLHRKYVEKPWGRLVLPPIFDEPHDGRIGEVWFTNGTQLPLLAKYIFTSERLSIQVHPNDEQARARGLGAGKSECWYILEAEPDATLGLGFRRELLPDELRRAALDGSIEELMNWRSVSAGDFYFVPAGTVHAIGAGITLLEFQQNSDVTYRLYDYGRPRELHLDDAVAVARTHPYPDDLARHLLGNEEQILVDGPHFTLVHTSRDLLTDRRRWVVPLEGVVGMDGEFARPGDCLLADAGRALACESARMLIGATAERMSA